MKYNVGDRVRIKSLDWYNKNKDNYGAIYAGNGFCFWKNMVRHCGEIMKITTVKVDPEDSNKGFYFMENSDEKWTDGMIEGLVEEKTLIERFDDNGLPFNEWLSHKGAFHIPDGYELKDENGNVINTHKIVLEKKNLIREEQIDNAAQEYIDSDNAVLTYSDGFCEQTDHPFVRAAFKAGVEWADNNVTQDDCSKAPKLTSQDYSNGRFGYRLPAGFKAKLTERELILTPEKSEYPKTYEECCEVLGFENTEMVFGDDYRDINPPKEQWKRLGLMNQFYQLLICRDAYWKIAGDWKPEYPFNTARYVITNSRGFVGKVLVYDAARNYILEFPTEEIRDAFYENFKELIEQCKELL